MVQLIQQRNSLQLTTIGQVRTANQGTRAPVFEKTIVMKL